MFVSLLPAPSTIFEVQVVQFHLPDRRLCVQEIELTKRNEDTACYYVF